MNSFMEKLENGLNKYLMPLADKINRNKVMTAIKEGMMSSLPVTLIASVALILSNFPFLSDFAPSVDAIFKEDIFTNKSYYIGITSYICNYRYSKKLF
ncbi:MAG: hypothetical protein ACLTYB_09765 [Clostridium paraputrificum]